MYGNFIQAIINFLIIAVVIFLMVKSINAASERASAKEEVEEEVAAEPELTREEKLLTEIRDLMKAQKG